MFDINNPAKNINVLVEYLKNIETNDFVYRGQIADYDSLLPSFYRKKISKSRFDQNTHKTLYQYDKNNHFLNYEPTKDSAQNIAKRVTMNELMKNFGKSLGNVMAQQYGINSECLDITSDINVAAFFATHTWPHYDKVHTSDRLGVIYRIPCSPYKPLQHAGIELDLSAVYLANDNSRIPLLFSSFKYQHTEAEFQKHLETYKLRLCCTISKPLICNHEHTIDIFKSYFNEKYREIDIESLYSTTRISRQKGGFIIPSFVFDSYVPSHLKETEIHNIKVYSPSFVIHKEKVVIEDILAFPRIEKYYFYHDSNIKSTLSREYLWPSKEEDYFYNLLYNWCSDGCKNYLNELNIKIDDMENGIIDKGYYNS